MPTVSAIVPATNAPPTLARCLDAIRAADDPPDEVIVAQEGHGHDAPIRFVLLSEKQFGHDGIVPVGEHVRLDQYRLPHHALDRVAAGVHLRRDVLDHDPEWRQCGRREERVL